MSPWLRWATGRYGPDAGPEWTGTALLDAAAGLEGENVARLRAVAFAVAQATREGDDHALRALAALLTRGPAVRVFDAGTLVNVLSALQFASMLPDETRADWLPPRHAVVRTVELGVNSGEALREQTYGLLWALVNRRLAADWLGGDGGNAVALSVDSAELREELVSQLHRHERLISIVAGGEEFPCVPA